MLPRKLSIGELSVISKHTRAINEFLDSEYSHLLVLEDDAILSEFSLEKIRSLLWNTRFDYYDLAGGDGIKAYPSVICNTPYITGEILKSPNTRTSCAYILNKSTAKDIITRFKTPCMPIDWQMMYALRNIPTPATVFWSTDELVTHGSSLGKVQSWRIN